MSDKHAERRAIERALANHATYSFSRMGTFDGAALIAAARAHLNTLPVPRTVYKATGVKPSGERVTLSFDSPDSATYAATSWLKKGMQHVAIFRDEV